MNCQEVYKLILYKTQTNIMKKILFLLLLITCAVNAQTNLKYDKRNVQCEDKWVSFQMNKDSTYSFGFIYIDSMAGLTFNYQGRFKIINNVFVIQKGNDSNVNVKVRLTPSRVVVAEIPEDRFKELNIEKYPDWLKVYKGNENSIERLYRWGFLYNGWGECAKALTYLEKAKEQQPNFKGLRVELAFSYNCMGKFDKAVTELQASLAENPKDAYVYKELIYAQIKSGQLDKAAETCAKATKICEDKKYNGENCYNLLVAYFTNKDKAKFGQWLDETKKWTADNTLFTKNVNAMEAELKK